MVNASSEKGGCVVNGMSYHGRDSANANSAIVVTVTPEDFPSDDVLAGVNFQRQWEEKAFRAGKGRGIYPCGEGAGYAGGITSAAMDGLRIAEAVAKVYEPYKKTEEKN